ncbi:hypothetical protein PAECIP111892_04644 [Paenibacillus auburnensis]|uniref:Uncharacterized protein n=1 Tax=Paenibacillus auburnensis TaxID=2905649 RepID=A0ABN8GUX9_9BACL|nr:hypothetical protein [Paenibacillus auburnensis]CAH1219009.1 hypothetical protein PAECIP111892_04644 [Paenibacillus auburnensis]
MRTRETVIATCLLLGIMILGVLPNAPFHLPLQSGTWTEYTGVIVTFIGIIVTAYFSWLLYHISKDATYMAQKAVEISENGYNVAKESQESTKQSLKITALVEKRLTTERFREYQEFMHNYFNPKISELQEVYKEIITSLSKATEEFLDKYEKVEEKYIVSPYHQIEDTTNLSEEEKKNYLKHHVEYMNEYSKVSFPFCVIHSTTEFPFTHNLSIEELSRYFTEEQTKELKVIWKMANSIIDSNDIKLEGSSVSVFGNSNQSKVDKINKLKDGYTQLNDRINTLIDSINNEREKFKYEISVFDSIIHSS